MQRASVRLLFGYSGIFPGATARTFIAGFVVAVAGDVVLTAHARSLNLLMLGERDAFDLGVEVERVRLVVFVAASLLVGSSVASGGSVGYVGLVVPHLVRLSLGGDNRMTIPAAAIVGGNLRGCR